MRRSKQFNDASKCSPGVQQFSAGARSIVGFLFGVILPTRRIVFLENLVKLVEISLDIVDEDRPTEHVIADRFADLAFASAADSARLVADYTFTSGTDQPP